MGADVKQTGEQFGSFGEVPALAGPRGEQEVLRRRVRDVLERGGRPAAGDRHHQAEAGHRSARRHALHPVDAVCSCRSRTAASAQASPTAIRRPELADDRPPCPARSNPSAQARASCSASRSSFSSSPPGRSRRSAASCRKTFLADPLTMVQDGWELLTRFGFLDDIGVTVWRVVGGFVLAAARRRAARHPDGRLQAGRGVPRALRLLRPLPAGLRLRAAADPLGRHRRDAEAARHLHRLGVPDHPDGRGRRRQHAPRPRRGGLHARRQRPRRRAPRADAGERARRSPRSCGSCSAGPGPTSSSPSSSAPRPASAT